jgi:tRNA A37 threonylcarbamoyladenosine synthetase subunit TsaC/SUA5/YrdC
MVRSPEAGPSVAVGARVEKALCGTYANVPGQPPPADASIAREADDKRAAGVERRYG